jgi:glyoxylase-like metal-dependent hydrolase (beta-lactamase superfamily II)
VSMDCDEVLNGEHAYTNDGHTAAWLASLDALARELKGVKVYPGHGAPGDASLFAWQKQYLTLYRKEVDRLRTGKDRLTDEQNQALVAKMKAAYPSAGLEFMITLGADTVAGELARADARRWRSSGVVERRTPQVSGIPRSGCGQAPTTAGR